MIDGINQLPAQTYFYQKDIIGFTHRRIGFSGFLMNSADFRNVDVQTIREEEIIDAQKCRYPLVN